MDASSQGRVVSLPLSQDCAAEDREGGLQELAYLHLKGLALTYVTAPDHTAVDLVVDTVQLDDAAHGSSRPAPGSGVGGVTRAAVARRHR